MTVQTHAALPGRKDARTADEILKKYATQLTAALAIVVCLTGVMMFFKWYKGEVEAMHEWLGMGFVVAVALHLTRHRRPLGMMLTQQRTRLILLLTTLIAAAFLVLAPAKGSNPVKQTVGAVLRAPLEEVAPLLGMSSGEALARLADIGITPTSPRQSLESLARASKTSPMKLLSAVLDPHDKD
jgi:hypothetical protein